MSREEISTLMARTLKGDFIDFTDCSNEVFKEFEMLQAENAELTKNANAYIQAKYVRTCRDFHKLEAENKELFQELKLMTDFISEYDYYSKWVKFKSQDND